MLDYCALVRSFGDQYSGMLPDDSAEVQFEGFTYAEAYEQALAQAQTYRTAGYAPPSGPACARAGVEPRLRF